MNRRQSGDATAGHRVYTSRFLSVYDLVVLGWFSNTAWRCPAAVLTGHYDAHASANHLDVGVGSGYFLDHCTFPTTPGRYTVDNMGNDLVRFIDLVIGRPVIVSGLSSGGVLSAWLSAFAKPGQVVAALYEDHAAVRLRAGPGDRALCFAGCRTDLRSVEQVVGRSVVHRGLGGDAIRGVM